MTGAWLASMFVATLASLLVLNTRRPATLELTVQDDQLVVRLLGWDVLFCMRRHVIVPVAAVDGVCVAMREAVPAQGLRIPGTSIPGVIRAGSFGGGDERDFWDVRRGAQVLVIQMKPGAHEYRRIVLEVPDVRGEMLRLRPVLGAAVLPLVPTSPDLSRQL